MNTNLWHTFYWKGWSDLIYSNYITIDDIPHNKSPQLYHEVIVLDEITKSLTEQSIPSNYQRVLFVKKHGKNYIIPTMFESELPVKPAETLECLEKKSNKTIHHFVMKVSSVRIPEDNLGTSLRQWVDGLNPIKHSNTKHLALMKLLAIASVSGGIGTGICSPTEFGKGINFILLKYMGNKISLLKSPTEAYLYQSACSSDVLWFVEITTAPADKVKLIENLVIALKDNTPELPKQALTMGHQKKSADLMRTSVVFTFNRPKDLNKGRPFEEVWGNPAAIKSRIPLFLFDGRVDQSMNNPSIENIESVLDENSDFFKSEMKKAKYWIHNYHTQLKGWDRSVLDLQGRHYTNTKVWIDLIEAYCETEDEFRDMLIELNKCKENYNRMVKGFDLIEETSLNNETGFPMVEVIKVPRR
jgi:hypothetical protein